MVGLGATDWSDAPESFGLVQAQVTDGVALGDGVTTETHSLLVDRDQDDGFVTIDFRQGILVVYLNPSLAQTPGQIFINVFFDVGDDGHFDITDWLVRDKDIASLEIVGENLALISFVPISCNISGGWLRLIIGSPSSEWEIDFCSNTIMVAGEVEDWFIGKVATLPCPACLIEEVGRDEENGSGNGANDGGQYNDEEYNEDHGNGRHHIPCNQGVGNGSEGCDPGNSNHKQPSNDEDDECGTPGNPCRGHGHKD